MAIALNSDTSSFRRVNGSLCIIYAIWELDSQIANNSINQLVTIVFELFFFFHELAFPLAYHRSGNAVTDHIGSAAAHIQQRIDAQ